MGQEIQIELCGINAENNMLEIEIQGVLPYRVQNHRFRMAAVFCGEHVDRHFPMAAYGTVSEGNLTQFHSSVKIQMDAVFFEYDPEPEEQIALKFRICTPEMRWLSIETDILWEAELFRSRFPKDGKREFPFLHLWKKLQYGLCTILLPVWMLQGYLAVRGYGRLHPLAEDRSGLKAALYHAHGLVLGWTGYGYSLRELKTNYFKEKYEKYCKHYPETEGVLFLSERRVEQGGNLDIIRQSLQEMPDAERQEEYGSLWEFLIERPVHKLKWGELRECASLAARSRVIILEDFYPQLHALSLRQETRILQMWHACGAFKLFGLSDLGITKHLEQSTRNHRNYNAALASSEGIIPFYSEAYGVPESHIYPVGIPRTDVFFDSGAAERIRERLFQKYPQLSGKKVVLFAPTFRGSGNKTAYYPVDQFPVDRIMEQLPEETVLILKNHPFIRDSFPIAPCYKDRVLDLTSEEQINDLLFITDLLITDYSSVIFEAALLRIPMLFYVFDLEEYLAQRDIYFDFVSFVPGQIVQGLPELIQAVRLSLADGDSGGEDEEFRRFFLGALDGHSTERVLELVKQLYRGQAVLTAADLGTAVTAEEITEGEENDEKEMGAGPGSV